ncbi:MAG: metalloregulator ArsR/SmtB family transcription factor [Lentisphaeria bacterium]|jgi:ArsR family transcriptional regulator
MNTPPPPANASGSSPEQRERAARVLQALAHPLRLLILQELAGGELTCRQLLERTGAGQSMLSQQLKLLESQGLVACRKQGTLKFCVIRNPEILKLFTCLHHHLRDVLKVG